MKIAVIDLGFNSLKLVNYVVRNDDAYSAYEQWALRAKLGEGMGKTGQLGGEQIRRTLNDLKLLRDLINFHSIDHVLPVATSAVREAANRNQFLKQAHSETGFSFRVLSGSEEAMYSFAGAMRAIAVPNVLFFDLGGGSLELVYAENFKIKNILSLPLGALRLSQKFADKSNGSYSGAVYRKLREHILEALPEKRDLETQKNTVLLGVGGALRTLSRYDQEVQQYPLNKIHNYSMSFSTIESLRRTLLEISPEGLAEIDSIGSDRADTIVAGACVVELLMEKFDFSGLVVSTHGLRDGILLEYLTDAALEEAISPGYIEDLLAQGRRPRFKFGNTEKFVDAMMSQELLDDRDRLILSYAMREILEKSQLWRPEPLFYIVMDEDSALSHRDQLLMALAIVRAKRPRVADWLYARYRALLKPKGKETIKRFSSLIEMLEILERTNSEVKLANGDSAEEGKINMVVLPNKQAFPTELFRNAVRDVEKVFDLSIRYSIKSQETMRPRA
jgi:exopolyphosphatase/guanosine-5'-triphosphate,3'-diphosphate pyrophosphatase